MPSVNFASKFGDVVALDKGDSSCLKLKIKDDDHLLNRFDFSTHKERVALVLGGNGFAGSHMIASLLNNSKFKKVIALVRPKKNISEEKRIKDALNNYEIQVSEENYQKLECIPGYYYEKKFGCTDEKYEMLCQTVDMVCHCAGTHDFEMSYLDYRKTHVLPFLHIFQFCISKKAKQIHYISSATANFYQENNDFKRPDSWWFSGYTQMKWVNTRLLLQAFSQGFSGCVYLPASYILGPVSTGNNPGNIYSLWRLAMLCERMGKIWDTFEFQTITADALAEAIVKNSLSSAPINYMPITFPSMNSESWAEILNCDLVSWNAFKTSLRSGSFNLNKRSNTPALITDDLYEATRKVLIDDGVPAETYVSQTIPSSYDVVKANWDFLKRRKSGSAAQA